MYVVEQRVCLSFKSTEVTTMEQSSVRNSKRTTHPVLHNYRRERADIRGLTTHRSEEAMYYYTSI